MVSYSTLAAVDSCKVRKSEIISALSLALDLTEGQPQGHAVRACVIGMHVAREIGIPAGELGDLYYALLLKDAGCSTNSSKMANLLGSDDIQAKRNVKTTDWTRVCWESVKYALAHIHPTAPFLTRMRAILSIAINDKRNAREMVQVRCERGAAIARRVGFSEKTAEAIYCLDELWNGAGHPQGLRGREIPLFSRIMNLAQTAEVFYTERGASAAVEVVTLRKGRWFDPEVARAFHAVARRRDLWNDLRDAGNSVLAFSPENDVMSSSETVVNEKVVDDICLAFADVVDAKSPFTFRHSTGVAKAAVTIGEVLGLPAEDLKLLRRAGLLHDIGKLSVSNRILDKPGKLDDEEWQSVREHPRWSYEILRRVPGFARISDLAGSHHEKLDGTGYYRHRDAAQLCLPSRILAVADIYDALVADRPYREGLPVEKVLAIIERDAPRALDGDAVAALRHALCGRGSGALESSSDASHLELSPL